MKLLSPVLVTLTLLTGCVYSAGGKGPAFESVAIGACNPTPCAKVKLETLPEFPASFTEAARENIMKHVEQALYAPLDDSGEEVSRDALLASVRAQYEDYLRDKDPDVVVDWSMERVASFVYTGGEVASVAVTNKGFLGGAHGFDDERLLVFDTKTGGILTWDDLISAESRSIFLKAAEAEFKRARGLPTDASLAEAGFSFDKEGDFGLPANFALTDKGIVCHYNPYEVGPFVMGATDFVVPMDVVGPSLTAQAALLLGRKEENTGLL